VTICAAIATGPDSGVAWADSEHYVGERPVHHAPKLLVNPLIGAVAVGCGWAALLRAAEERFASAAVGIDDLAGSVAHALRRAAVQQGAALDRAGDNPSTAFAMLGFSARWHRTVVIVFASDTLFVPMRCRAFAAPQVHGWNTADAEDRHSVISVAQDQMAALRRDMPHASGRVTVATIAGGGVTAWPPFAAA